MQAVDDILERLSDWIRITFENIDHWHGLVYIILNGFLVAFATTGYLGEDSVPIWSLAGGLFVAQFVQTIGALVAKISPDSQYLSKMMVAGLSGFAFQWETLSMLDPKKGFEPIVDHGFGVFIFYASFLGAMLYCFTGNQSRSTSTQIDPEELDRLRAIAVEYERMKTMREASNESV